MQLKKLRTAIVAAAALSLLVVPAAMGVGEGSPLDGGTRNPTNDQTDEYTRETEIIANSSSYGTRQSNKSNNGGGAIYGCRSGAGGSPANNEPCIRANNLQAGLAFEFESNGLLGGTINVGTGGDNFRPFTTNATGVATGLNADEVDGMSAQQIIAAAGGGGGGSGDQADHLFAVVDDTAGGAALGRNSGATDVDRTATGRYRLTFNRGVSDCAYQVTARDSTPLIASAQPTSNGQQVNVYLNDDAGAAESSDFSIDVRC